jgi:hypothetical protein
VETAGVLQSLGTNILRGRMTVRAAAQRANQQVTEILNAES